MKIISFLLLFLGILPTLMIGQKDEIAKAEDYEQKANKLVKVLKLDSAASLNFEAGEIYKQQKEWFKSVRNFRFASIRFYNSSKANMAILSAENALNIANAQFKNKTKVEVEEKIKTLLALGYAYKLNGKFENKLKVCLKADSLAFTSNGISKSLSAKIWNELGRAYHNLAEYEKAIKLFKKALKERKAIFGNDHTKVGDSYNSLGMSYYMKDELDKAIKCFQEDLRITILEQGEHHPNVAICYTNLGVILSDKGDLDKALKYHKDALNIDMKAFGENHHYMGQNYHNIGAVFFEMGIHDKGLKYYKKALQIYRSNFGEIHPYLSNTYTNIGVIYDSEGSFHKAMEYFQKALNIEIRIYGEKHENVSMTYSKIGMLYNALGDDEKALKLYEKALNIFTEVVGEKHSDVAEIYDNIAKVYENKGDFIKAEEYYQKSLSTRTDINGQYHPSIAKSYDLLGKLCEVMEKYTKAIEYYNKSLNIRTKYFGKKHPDLARSYANIGDLYNSIENYQESLYNFQKSIIANLPNFKNTSIYSNPNRLNAYSKPYLLRTLHGKAKTFYSNSIESNTNSEMEASIKSYDLLFKLIHEMRSDYEHENTKLLLSEKTKRYFSDGIVTAIDYGEIITNIESQNKAFEYIEKSKSATLSAHLNSIQIKSYWNIADSLLEEDKNIAINRRYYNTKIQEAKAQRGGYDTLLVQDYQNKLFDYSRQKDSLINTLKNHYPDYYKLKYQQVVAGVDVIQTKLNENTALINYFLADTTLFIAVVTENVVNYKTIKIDSLFNQKLIDYYIDIKSGYSKEELSASNYLYKYLIKPVEELIKDKDNLVIIPDGYLFYLPFETLCESENYPRRLSDLQFLIKKHAISYHQSATLWLNSRNQTNNNIAATKSFVGFAPVFDPKTENGYIISNEWITDTTSTDVTMRSLSTDLKQFNKLPYSEVELKSIINLFEKQNGRAKGYFHHDANEENFKSNASNYDFVHIASHSFTNDKYPALSGIAFSQPDTSSPVIENGILFASESYNLNLPNTELVVLSSCKSGLGKLAKGEGLLSISRGFLYAGVPNIIYSLWNVKDEATKDLMIEFYKQVLKGNGFATSLRKAKLKLLKNKATSEPKYWAAWSLIGR